MNEYDSNRIADIVKSKDYVLTEDVKNIDCYVLNTCHIREKATEKVYHDIGRLKKNYKNKKKPIVLITGCVAQAENEEMLKREPYIDAVVGPQSYHKLPEILSKLKNSGKKINLTDFDVIQKFDKLNRIKYSDSNVSSFISTNSGIAPRRLITSAVAIYVNGVVIIKSPGFISIDINDIKSAAVPDEHEITCFWFVYSESISSRARTSGPIIYCP